MSSRMPNAQGDSYMRPTPSVAPGMGTTHTYHRHVNGPALPACLGPSIDLWWAFLLTVGGPCGPSHGVEEAGHDAVAVLLGVAQSPQHQRPPALGPHVAAGLGVVERVRRAAQIQHAARLREPSVTTSPRSDRPGHTLPACLPAGRSVWGVVGR